MINFPTESRPDVLNAFCATRTVRMYGIINAFVTQIFSQFFESQSLLQVSMAF